MSPKQRDLLYALHNNGGSINGADLSRVMRSVASRMQLYGWVDWEPPKGRHAKNLDDWRLHITDKGRGQIMDAAAKLEETE